MKVENRIYYPLQPQLISITQPLFSQLDRDKKVVAELKYNGDHLILKRFKTGKFEFWTRHGTPFKKYVPSPGLIRELNELSWQGPPLPQSISNPIPYGESISRNPLPPANFQSIPPYGVKKAITRTQSSNHP